MGFKSRSYNERRRILEKHFKSSMIYSIEEATALMGKILGEIVDESFVRRYLEEHDCIIKEKRNKKNKDYITMSSPEQPISTITRGKKEKLPLRNNNQRKKKGIEKEKNDGCFVKERRTSIIGIQQKYDLVKNNLHLVYKYAKRFQKSFLNQILEYDELVSEGVIGLYEAIDCYQKDRIFSKAATPWIKRAMVRAIITKGSSFAIPTSDLNCFYTEKYSLKNQNLGKVVQFNFMLICTELNLSPYNKKDLNNIEKRFFHLYSKESMLCDKEIINILYNHSYEQEQKLGESQHWDLNDFLDEIERYNAITYILYSLKERERKVIYWRLGLEDGKERTLEEVGKKLNLTRERIRQIEKNAIQLLQNKCRDKNIRRILRNT